MQGKSSSLSKEDEAKNIAMTVIGLESHHNDTSLIHVNSSTDSNWTSSTAKVPVQSADS